MFVEINNNVYNVINIQNLIKSQDDNKYYITYIIKNGSSIVEEFDDESSRNSKCEEVESAGGGGGGEASTDWSVIGYNNEPEGITNEILLAKDIYDNWDASVTSCRYMFDSRAYLQIMPLVDTSNCTNFEGMFYRCTFLSVVPSLDTSKGTTLYAMFNGCQAIKTIPRLDLSSAINVSSMFTSCNQLKNLYGFKDLGKAYDITAPENVGNYTLNLAPSSNLTHESVINVFNDLYDIATKGCNRQRIYLASAVYNTLTPEEIAIATDKGWDVISG